MKKDTKKEVVKKETVKKVNKKPTPKKEKKVKENYFKAVMAEMKKVKWPDTKEMVKYSVATIVFCLLFALYFQGLDFVSSLVKGLFN